MPKNNISEDAKIKSAVTEIEHGGVDGDKGSLQVPEGVEPMVDGEEEKVPPMSHAGNSSHGGKYGDGRED